MCGIVGFISAGKGSIAITEEHLRDGLEESMTRGKEATGFFSDVVGVIKAPVDATEFCKKHDKKLKNAAEGRFFLGHTRAATGGAWASNNNNNHPHESKRYVLIHNGVFSSLPLVKDYKYAGKCDSEIALSYIETFGIQQALPLFSDTDGFSLVIYDKVEDMLYFIRNRNPMCHSFCEKTKAFYFGSTSDIVMSMFPSINVNGLPLFAGTYPASTAEGKLYSYNLKENRWSIGKEAIKFRKFTYELDDNKEVGARLLVDDFKRENHLYPYEKKTPSPTSETYSTEKAQKASPPKGIVNRFFVQVDMGNPFYGGAITN